MNDKAVLETVNKVLAEMDGQIKMEEKRIEQAEEDERDDGITPALVEYAAKEIGKLYAWKAARALILKEFEV